MTDLRHHIDTTPLADTHEHLRKEKEYMENGPDVLQDLFGNYVTSDLVVAGASPEAMRELTNTANEDIAGRFAGIREAWERVQHTGYGEAVRLIAEQAYGIEELTPDSIAAAAPLATEMRKPGERLRILKERANIDHVQIDDFCWQCAPDESGPDFFLYDLSWRGFCNGDVDVESLHTETGIEATSIPRLREAMSALFEKHGPCAIAVKAQHAYNRTLRWHERDDADAELALARVLAGKAEEADHLCLGDWAWARGVELAAEHGLPFKLHTGYYAGQGRMVVDRIPAGHLCPLFARYPQTRFVLMHIAYPYSDELAALAKHFPNVYADMCWGWSIDPYSACRFVRGMIHAAPANKLFAFGGDTPWPNSSVAYATQARRWLTHALQQEIEEGWMTERQAMALAKRFMYANQHDVFDLEGTRESIRQRLTGA